MNNTRLLVRKNLLTDTRLSTSQDKPLADGQIRMRVDSFALTSNNITYAAFGDAMNYWQFFPTQEEGWGCIPVWGFASVAESLCEGVKVGERFYGYYPMASETVLNPTRVNSAGFFDGAGHRRELHPVYNQYLHCSTDPLYTPETEDAQALLRPLFMTSWLIDDFLADNNFFGAQTMLLSSASSKTAYGTAFQLAQRPGMEVIGLTSASNVAFCESLGCYGRVLSYEQLDQVAEDAACIYVDFAGSAPLRRNIHSRFTHLKYSCSIGGTHVEQLGGAKDLPGPRVTLFFAPAQIKKRHADWGAEQLGMRLQQGWQSFIVQVFNAQSPWLCVQRHQGPQQTQQAYAQVLAGQGDPRVGHVLSMA